MADNRYWRLFAAVRGWCDAGGASWQADGERPYCVAGPNDSGKVEAWSGYPLQFGGQLRFEWQNAMAAELRQAIGALSPAPAAVLAGRYLSTDRSRCDVENRLFTNVGASTFPRGLAAIRFERGTGPLPPPPARSPLLQGICITTATASDSFGSRGEPAGTAAMRAAARLGGATGAAPNM